MTIMTPIQDCHPLRPKRPLTVLKAEQLKDYTTIHVRISNQNAQMAATSRRVSIRCSVHIVNLRV